MSDNARVRTKSLSENAYGWKERKYSRDRKSENVSGSKDRKCFWKENFVKREMLERQKPTRNIVVVSISHVNDFHIKSHLMIRLHNKEHMNDERIHAGKAAATYTQKNDSS